MIENSAFFKNGSYQNIEEQICKFLNEQDRNLIRVNESSDSPRTTGDKLPKILGKGLEDIVTSYCNKFTMTTTGKPMENYIISGRDGFDYHVMSRFSDNRKFVPVN